VYLAETAECAYAEVLAYTKRRLGQQDPLTKDAAAVGLSVAEFSGLVGAKWSERQHMGVGHLPSSWRIERLLYRIMVPEAGRWVDIQHPDSLAAAETELEAELATLDLSALTVAALLGDDRHVTTAVARWGARPTPGRRQHRNYIARVVFVEPVMLTGDLVLLEPLLAGPPRPAGGRRRRPALELVLHPCAAAGIDALCHPGLSCQASRGHLGALHGSTPQHRSHHRHDHLLQLRPGQPPP